MAPPQPGACPRTAVAGLPLFAQDGHGEKTPKKDARAAQKKRPKPPLFSLKPRFFALKKRLLGLKKDPSFVLARASEKKIGAAQKNSFAVPRGRKHVF